MSTKQEEANLILKLYELRRDMPLRNAREWFTTEFDPQSAEEIVRLMLSGHRESARYRIVTSYWDMAAALVNHGAIDEQMFNDANSEHLVIFAKIEPFLADVRAGLGTPEYLAHFEQLVMRVPDVKERLAKRRKLLKRWAEAHKQSKRRRARVSSD
ncbi:MAG TPA: hypothetical protein VF666_18680 [Pyrinomonadaceae bacterium]